MDKTTKLQSKINLVLEGLTPEDHELWLSHPCTKLLMATLDLDEENLRLSWSLGNFDKREEGQAQGQAFYILGLRDDLRHMLADKEALEEVTDDA